MLLCITKIAKIYLDKILGPSKVKLWRLELKGWPEIYREREREREREKLSRNTSI